MKLLVVGAGSVGKRHLRNFHALGVREFGVVETREDRRIDVRTEPGVVAVDDDLASALRNSYDAAIVCAPTAFHVEIGSRCLDAGAHVLMEKPISHTSEGVADMVERARRGGRTLMVGYTYRFWPPLQRVASLLESGRIGRLLWVDISFSQYLPDWHPWEDYRSWFMSKREQGGGALLDESHTIDMVRWLAGEIRDVSCEVGNLSDLEMTADDFAHFTVGFASGAGGSIHMDVFGRLPRRTLMFSGVDGTISCDLNRNEVSIFVAGDEQPATTTFTCERNEMFVAEARHFLEVIEGRAAPLVSAEDAARTLAVLEAGRKSSETGKRVTVA